MNMVDRRKLLLEHISQHSPQPNRVEIGIRLAGIQISLLTDSADLERQIRNYFHDYLATGPATGEIFISTLDPSSYPAEIRAEMWEDADPEFHFQDESVVQRDFVARHVRRVGQ